MDKQQSSLRTTLIGAACLSLQPLLLNAISVPVMAYLIHRLGPTGYGQCMVATSLLSTCAILTNLGLRGAFIRSVAANPAAAATQLADQLGLRFLLTAAAALTAILAGCLLGYTATVLYCTAIGGIGLVLTTFAATLSDLLQATHQFKTVAFVNFAAGLALTLVSLLIAFTSVNPVAIAAAYLTGPILSALLLTRLVRRLCRVALHWDFQRFGQLLIQSRFFAAQQFLAVGTTQAESLILPKLVGISQFGLFSAGTLLASRLTAIPDGLCTAAYPAMSRACADGDSRRSMFIYLAIAALGGTGIAVLVTLSAAPIGWILFHSQPDVVARVIRITIWSLPLMAVESVMGYALNAAGKDAAQSRASLPAALVSLTISIALITTLGVIGASFSMLLRPAVRAAFLAPLFLNTFGTRDTSFDFPQPLPS